MTQPQLTHHSYKKVTALVAILGLVASLSACNLFTPSPPPQTPTPRSPTPTTPAPTISSGKVQLYWIKENANALALVPATFTPTTGTPPNRQLEAGLQRLLTGPINADVSTSIPTGTQLNSVQVKPDGVHIDLSREFMSGGGSASMQGRLGQVIYTASSLEPTTKVWISIAGEPLRVLGGEGLEVPHPITRQEFDRDFKF